MDDLNLKGAKGGGSGSGSKFTQTPDNLRSDDTFEEAQLDDAATAAAADSVLDVTFIGEGT